MLGLAMGLELSERQQRRDHQLAVILKSHNTSVWAIQMSRQRNPFSLPIVLVARAPEAIHVGNDLIDVFGSQMELGHLVMRSGNATRNWHP